MLHLECKPDEALARTLGRTRKQCLHHSGKGRVCTVLMRGRDSVGMMDEDPRSAQPQYLATLQEGSNLHDVRLLQDPTRNHTVVILCPRLEEWLIKTAHSSGFKMGDFGLSDRGNELHQEINTRLAKIEELIRVLLNADSDRLRYLQSLIA
jgi:hypothetical protein